MTRAVGAACLGSVLVILAAQPLIAPHDPRRVDLGARFRAPGPDHLLGTDALGRDVLARLAAGAWDSLLLAVVALALSSVVGLAIGCLAGAGGRVADRALSALVDLLLAFPKFLILLNAAAVFTFDSTLSVGVLVGATTWMGTARLVRTEVLSLGRRPFIEAARAAGAGTSRILVRHLAPHLLRLVFERTGLRFAGVILAATSLGYLGIGVAADRPTWGSMIQEGQVYLRSAPWVALSAVAALCLVVVGLVLVGESPSRGGVRQST
jgi:peptide/nickel transport system permease protein